MWGLILTVGAVIVVALFPAVRCTVTHPLHVLWYGLLDSFTYLRHKDYNRCHTGDLDIYCGYFGSGKTLSLVCTSATTVRPSGARAGANSSPSGCSSSPTWR